MRFQVRELRVKYLEGGDIAVMYLCGGCEESTADFLRILRRRRYDTSCDRCGLSAGDIARDEALGRP